MGQAINLQKQATGVVNHTTGSIVTDAVAASALSIQLGFSPRIVRLHNLTDRISDEWYRDMSENGIYVSLLGITAKLDADAGVTDVDFGALWNPVATAGVNAADNGIPANDLGKMRASLIGILAKLDADGGVSGTDYSALWTPAVATIDALVASIAGMNAKLDLDGGVTDTNYAATWNCPNTMSLHTVATGARTYERTNGVKVDAVANTVTFTATTMVASKQFYFEAIG
jgi:hypothetical protein